MTHTLIIGLAKSRSTQEKICFQVYRRNYYTDLTSAKIPAGCGSPVLFTVSLDQSLFFNLAAIA